MITGQNEDEILQAIKTMARTGLAEGFIVLYSREQDPVLDYLYEEGLLYVLIGKACRNVNQARSCCSLTGLKSHASSPTFTLSGSVPSGMP